MHIRDIQLEHIQRGLFVVYNGIAVSRDVTAEPVKREAAALRAEIVPINDQILNFDSEFVFSELDAYGWLIYGSAFTEGAGMRLVRDHNWVSGGTMGAGTIYHPNAVTAGFRGELKDNAERDSTIREYLTSYNSEVTHGIQPEVSIGFFLEEFRWGEDLTEAEQDAGAWVAVDGADGVEVSTVYRGAVNRTWLTLAPPKAEKAHTVNRSRHSLAVLRSARARHAAAVAAAPHQAEH